ncbi:Cyclic pyranopterin monophosphate synthase 1 [Pelotomaculum schinkii]|uniref:Cyclic pyranopterin monophosphate synthase 1 n=1 Tax=Pelotomaculum schinkii TaxID=78350 RepID=A0A4Y7RID6_9FIRM|nr:Cyclic pyranopterin monophosphate synthase 1 [Pelotomaculum schinkii]
MVKDVKMQKEIICSCNTDHASGCLVCGGELFYNADSAIDVKCVICGKEEQSNTICVNGHYICDECHREKILDVVERVCVATNLTDPVEIALQIFKLPGLHMHGPEYHSIVAAVLVTAYGNSVKDKQAQAIKEAIKRGKDIKGGVCGTHGACGAGVGVGVAYSIIHQVTPYSKEERGAANRLTALALLEISRFGGPRCCKRDAMISIETAKRNIKEFDNNGRSRYICSQFMNNQKCIQSQCPYFPEKIVLGETESLCPVCLSRIPAQKVKYGAKVYLEKTCPQHGDYKTIIWNGPPDYKSWELIRQPSPSVSCITKVDKGCPYDCGICPGHRQNTCCVLLEITNRCNLLCPVCFASSQENAAPDPSLEEIGAWYDTLMRCGGPFNIQLSGGEPSLRDDIADIIRLGKEKGFSFFQLNTNGLRLAEEPAYVETLQKAGLNCVFLQFDAMSDEPYFALRGRKLLETKLQAIENCIDAGLGVVLVPTLVPGLNENEIGPIIRFAIENMPHIRGVHFQPVSYFGRYGEKKNERITIPDVLRAIEEQTGGQMKVEDFRPGTAENSYCSFNASFLLQPDGTLKVLPKTQNCCCSSSTEQKPAGDSKKAREYVARQWSSAPEPKWVISRYAAPGSFDEFLERRALYTLAVSGMAFQDAWNLDLTRLQECYIHVVSPDRRIIPFCAYNLTSITGDPLYRGVNR